MSNPPLARLVETAWQQLLQSSAATAGLPPAVRRDEDASQGNPVLVIEAKTGKRVHGRAAIREAQVDLTLKANAKMPTGQADAFSDFLGALETLLESDLETALNALNAGVHFFRVKRDLGASVKYSGLVREQTYSLTCVALDTRYAA